MVEPRRMATIRFTAPPAPSKQTHRAEAVAKGGSAVGNWPFPSIDQPQTRAKGLRTA